VEAQTIKCNKGENHTVMYNNHPRHTTIHAQYNSNSKYIESKLLSISKLENFEFNEKYYHKTLINVLAIIMNK